MKLCVFERNIKLALVSAHSDQSIRCRIEKQGSRNVPVSTQNRLNGEFIPKLI